jgi:hypothetical protein
VRTRFLIVAGAVAMAALVAACGDAQPAATPIDPGAPVVVVHPAAPAARVSPVKPQPLPVAQIPATGGVAPAAVLPGEAQHGPQPANTTGPGPAIPQPTLPGAASALPATGLQSVVNGLGPPAVLGGFAALQALNSLLNTLQGNN